jgi:hypothetical protein
MSHVSAFIFSRNHFIIWSSHSILGTIYNQENVHRPHESTYKIFSPLSSSIYSNSFPWIVSILSQVNHLMYLLTEIYYSRFDDMWPGSGSLDFLFIPRELPLWVTAQALFKYFLWDLFPGFFWCAYNNILHVLDLQSPFLPVEEERVLLIKNRMSYIMIFFGFLYLFKRDYS